MRCGRKPGAVPSHVRPQTPAPRRSWPEWHDRTASGSRVSTVARGGSCRPPSARRCWHACSPASAGRPIRSPAPRSGWPPRVDQGTMTLGGCIILTRRAELLVCREAGRISDRATLATGDRLLWDGRWELQAARAPGRIELRALGPDGRSALSAAVRAALRRADIPAAALEPLPAAWAEGRLLVCPPLAAWEPRRAGAVLITAAFRPTYPLTAAEFGGVNVVSNPQPPIYRREAGSDPASEIPSALSSSGMPGPTSRRAQ